jgi:hypothetical protein
MSIELPRWVARVDATRTVTDYSDLLLLVARHLSMFSSAETYLGPYNARQRQTTSKVFYTSPSREELRQIVKSCGVNEITYSAFLSSLIRFCDETKGLRALPLPHPSTLHSIQLPQGTFEISTKDGVSELSVMGGSSPITLKGLRNPGQYKFIVLRPKLARSGTPSAKNWEALLFTQNLGYVPMWVDSMINPRWAGQLS